jgi:hypothetical protein
MINACFAYPSHFSPLVSSRPSFLSRDKVLPLVFALVWLSLLVDSFTTSAVVHTVAPTIVVVVLLLLPKSVVVMPTTSGARNG